jgi:hypothetical protein
VTALLGSPLEGYPLGGDAWPEGQDFRDIILNKV